jgi:hypothetical protein
LEFSLYPALLKLRQLADCNAGQDQYQREQNIPAQILAEKKCTQNPAQTGRLTPAIQISSIQRLVPGGFVPAQPHEAPIQLLRLKAAMPSPSLHQVKLVRAY